MLCNLQAARIYHRLPKGIAMLEHRGEIAESVLFRVAGYFFAWFVGCFALGAISSALRSLNQPQDDADFLRDGYREARAHLLPLFAVASTTFAIALAGYAAIVLGGAAAGIAGKEHAVATSYIGATLIAILVLAVLSWFGMAIPAVLGEKLYAWPAIKRSLKLTDGYEGYLLFLVLESVLASYSGYYLLRYAVGLLLSRYSLNWDWMQWLVFGVAIAVSAAVQPPMYIGFSLLHRELSSRSGANNQSFSS
jgi:hypothetical protein